MVMMMKPLGIFYSAHCSVHIKWRVATHSDHSCSGCMSEGLGCCNLICLSCKVKAFIISARGVRCHLHWTWHMHASLTVGDHTHAEVHTSVNTTQTVGDGVERWGRDAWGRDGQERLWINGRWGTPRSARLRFTELVKVMGRDVGRGERDAQTQRQKAGGKLLRSVVPRGVESDGENEERDWWDSMRFNQTWCDVIWCPIIYSSPRVFPLTFFSPFVSTFTKNN